MLGWFGNNLSLKAVLLGVFARLIDRLQVHGAGAHVLKLHEYKLDAQASAFLRVLVDALACASSLYLNALFEFRCEIKRELQILFKKKNTSRKRR